jgi:hypothetical protein
MKAVIARNPRRDVKAVIALVLAVFAAVTVSAAESKTSRFDKISIVGEDPGNGYFDLSIEYGDDGRGWLAYSRVAIPKYVETHLATSTDQGRTWVYAGAVNQSGEGSVLIGGKRVQGVWRYETPTLVFDPSDLEARRWKFFVQRYLSVAPHRKGNSLFEKGGIEYKYAANPAGPWSDGVCMFGKIEYGCRVDLNSLNPELKNVVYYNELGSIVVDGVIFLSMDASATSSGLGSWEQRKIVLVSSRDHGVTWDFVGTLTDYSDASALGYVALTGSSLVEEDGRLFVLLTPSGARGLFKKNRAHDGTLVVEFDDIHRAKLKRDANGKLVVLKAVRPDLHSGGLSDYDEDNSYGGILFSQINPRAVPEFFQIFNTMLSLSR